MTCYLVSGTQAERAHVNNIIVMKMSNLHGTNQQNEECDDDDDDDDDDEKDPELETALIKHNGSINRIRVSLDVFTTQNRSLVITESSRIRKLDLGF